MYQSEITTRKRDSFRASQASRPFWTTCAEYPAALASALSWALDTGSSSTTRTATWLGMGRKIAAPMGGGRGGSPPLYVSPQHEARDAVLPPDRPDRARHHPVSRRAEVDRARRAPHGVFGGHLRDLTGRVPRGDPVRPGRRGVRALAQGPELGDVRGGTLDRGGGACDPARLPGRLADQPRLGDRQRHDGSPTRDHRRLRLPRAPRHQTHRGPPHVPRRAGAGCTALAPG